MTARGNNRERLFLTARDYGRYEAILGAAVRRFRWYCLAYCLMPNHVHLLIETPEPNLAAGMQRAHGEYGRSFNDWHGRSGHVFEGRYGAVLVESDRQLLTTASYIAANPVDGALCAAPGDWPWSSHARVGGSAAPPWVAHPRLIDLLAGPAGDGSRAYSDAVAARLPAGPPS